MTNETKPTPDAEMYSILGKLSTGTLLYVNYTLADSNYQSQCQCYDTASMEDGTVVAVAAAVDENVTVALVNACNCSKAVDLRLEVVQIALQYPMCLYVTFYIHLDFIMNLQ